MSESDERGDLREKGAAAGCPDPGVLAAFLDGTLEGREKKGVQAHLAACSDCFSLFGESAEFLRETPFPAARVETYDQRPGRALSRAAVLLVPLAVAAMLAVALLRPFRVAAPTLVAKRDPSGSLGGPSGRGPVPAAGPVVSPSTRGEAPAQAELVHLLIEGQDLSRLTREAWEEENFAAYSFAESTSREHVLVLVGVYLLDLEVALRQGDVVAGRKRLARLELLAKAIDEGPAVRAFGEGLNRQRRDDLDTDGLRAQLEDGATRRGARNARRLIRFGEWVEACRLAAAVRHARYFDHPQVRHGLVEAGELPFGAAMRRPLGAVERLLRPAPASEEAWRRLEYALRDILLVL